MRVVNYAAVAVLAGAFGGAVVKFMPAFGTPTSNVVRSRAFELVDSKGARRGTWGITPDGFTALSLYDAQDKARVELEFSPAQEAASLMFLGKDGNSRMRISTGWDGLSRLSMGDKMGRGANLILGARTNDTPPGSLAGWALVFPRGQFSDFAGTGITRDIINRKWQWQPFVFTRDSDGHVWARPEK